MENQISVGLSQRTSGPNGLVTSGFCIGDPNVVAAGAGLYAPNCVLFQKDSSTNYQTIVWLNTGTATVPVWTQQAILDANVVTKKVTLTSAQIKALNGTPIELIAAPGAGKLIDVLAVSARLNFLTAAYDTNTELDIIDATAGTKLFFDTANILGATTTKTFKMQPAIAANAGLLVTTNGAVNAKVLTGNPATGAGTLDIYITYKVITL